MRKTVLNNFSGGRDNDTDLHFVKPSDYLRALNVQNSYNSEEGSFLPKKGNELVANTLPAGDNYCIGAFEDKLCNSIIFFNQNSGDAHGIYRYHASTNTIEELSRDSVYAFSKDRPISQCCLIDGRYLAWVDGKSGEKSITGNPPRCVDIIRLAAGDYPNDLSDFHINLIKQPPACPPLAYFVKNPANKKGFDDLYGNVFQFATRVLYVCGAKSAFSPVSLSPTAIGKRSIGPDGSELMSASLDKEYNEIEIDYSMPMLSDADKLTEIKAIEIMYRTKNEGFWYSEAVINKEDFGAFTYRFTAEGSKSIVPSDSSSGVGDIQAFKLFDNVPRISGALSMIADGQGNTRLALGANLEGYDCPSEVESTITLGSNIFYDDSSGPDACASLNVTFRVGDPFPTQPNLRLITVEVNVSGSLEVTLSDDDGVVVQTAQGYASFPAILTVDSNVIPATGSSYKVGVRFTRGFCSYAASYEVNKATGVYASNTLGASVLSGNPQITTTNLSLDANRNMFLKEGGSYDFGVVYKDEYNRRCTVSKLGEVFIDPFEYKVDANIYRVLVAPKLTIEITSDPPSWAHSYEIVRTRNKKQMFFRQEYLVGNAVKYYKDLNEVYTEVEDPEEASIVGFSINSLLNSNFEDDTEDRPIEIKNFTQEASRIFTPEEGDRVRIIARKQADWFLGDGHNQLTVYDPIDDYGIDACRLDDNGNMELIIRKKDGLVFPLYDNDVGGFSGGVLIEVYRPNNSGDGLYYETGNCYLIEGGSHLDNTDGSGVEFKGGDVTIRRSEYEFDDATNNADRFNSFLAKENDSPYDDVLNTSQDIGWGNVYYPDYGETFLYNSIRTSEIYIKDSNINGIPSFKELDYIKIDQSFGIIKYLALLQNVLLAICEFKTQPLYLAKGRLLDLSGGETVGRTDTLLNLARELRASFGTQHPESVAMEDGNCYAWDERRGRWWKYSSNGQYPFSDEKMVNAFSDLGIANLNGDVVSIFDRKYNDLLFSHPGGVSYSYQEGRNRFGPDYEFRPDRFGRIGQLLVSFKDGALWKHESDTAPYANFYGEQKECTVELVVNPDAASTKLWWNIKLQADKKFFVRSITSPLKEAKSIRSKLLANKIYHKEGMYFGNFLRDMNDDSYLVEGFSDTKKLFTGRKLRSEVLILELVNVDLGEFFRLNSVTIEYTISKDNI